MSSFKRYPKVHRLGKDETDGILFGDVHVEEKIDGANAQIWLHKGKVCCGSRNNTLCTDVHNPPEGTNMFDGFVEWCAKSGEVSALLEQHPEYRLYGEWLVKHTIHYNETAYQQFYLFDISIIKEGDQEEEEERLPKEEVRKLAEEYGLKVPHYHGLFTNPSVEELLTFVGKSKLGQVGEGVVLKNNEFRDKFGSHNHAKIVSDKFKEQNLVVFGGNSKHSVTYWEIYIVNKYMTLPRIRKVMQKLQPVINEKLDLKHIPRISGTAYHDMLEEEIWEIAKKAEVVNFRSLKRLADRKAIQIYKDILLGTTSVADKE